MRWLEKISEFDFNIRYIPGMENILPDALSRLYSNDAPGTVRAPSEYVQFADEGVDEALHNLISMPVLVGTEAGDNVAPHKGIPQERLDPTPEPRSLVNQGKQGVARDPGPQPILALAESGRPETATEFARRMRDRFVLRGPRERTEGGMTEETRHNHPEIQPEATESMNESANDERHENVLLTFLDNDNLMSKIKGQYVQDSFFKLILEVPERYHNFKVMDGYVQLQTKDQATLCIPGITIEGRNLREHLIEQAHSLLAHLGPTKTLMYLKDHLWWKDMTADVKRYCESCATCKRSKPSNQRPYGMLTPLDVPSRPWESIGIDFLSPLPLSGDRNGEYNSIVVIIDHLTGMVHLVPCRTDYTA